MSSKIFGGLKELVNPGYMFHKILKSGGILILTVPLMQAVHEVPHDFFKIYFAWIDVLGAENGI